MDSSHFDDLTRSLSTGITRRAALTAAVLGALGWRRTAGAQVTQAQCGNKACKNNPGRCADGCVCCVYPNGNSRCQPPGACGADAVICPAERPIFDPALGCVASTAGNGSVDATDPTFPPQELCNSTPLLYDPIVFQHDGGPLSLAVRGAPSGGGTLADPILFLYAGNQPPGSYCDFIAGTDDVFCPGFGILKEPYIELDLPAGTYTAAILGFDNGLGSYTLERNLFVNSCPT